MSRPIIYSSIEGSRNFFSGPCTGIKLWRGLGLFIFKGCLETLPGKARPSFRKNITLPGRVGLIAFLLLWASVAYTQAVVINDSVATLTRKSCNTTAIAAIPFEQLIFKKSVNRRVDLNIMGNHFHFIILKLSAPVNMPGQYLSVDNTNMDSVFMYSIREGEKPVKLYQGGKLIPWQEDRSLIWHTIPLEVGPKASYILLAVKAPEKIINLNYDLLGREALITKYAGYNRIIFFYIGIAFMVSAIILLALFLFKKKVFAIYFGYMLCISLWIIDHYGMLYPYFYPGYPMLNKIIQPLSSLGAAFLLLTTQSLIFKPYLETSFRLFRVVSLLKTYLLILLSLMLLLLIPALPPSFKVGLIVLNYTGLLMAIALVVFIPLHFLNTSKVARIISFAMLAICLTTLEQLMANTGFIKYRFMNEHGMALGSLIENSIMAFGLLYGLLIERREKNMLVLALQKEQQKMLKKLITVQHNERKRIAADLHDNIGPLLAALKINFRRIIQMNSGQSQSELIEKTESIIDDSISEIRSISHNLMPKGLSSKGLINTLEDYFENVQQLYGKKLLFSHEVDSIFKPEIQINIYFIITELVLNAAKHSNAQLINVLVKTELNKVILKILDNGQGFQTPKDNTTHSLGLQSAESRTNFLKGKFSLISQNGSGTLVDISIPL